MSILDKIKAGAKTVKNKVIEEYNNIKDNNTAKDKYEKQATEFKVFNDVLNTTISGNVDYENLEFTCLASEELKDGSILKDLTNNKEFKVISITREGKTFDPEINGIEPFKLDVCKINII